jgi:Carboxypeptidase regulatory-like domain
MTKRIGFSFLLLALLFCLLTFATSTPAQQTLGGVTGTVTDTSGAAVADTTVTLVGDQTSLSRTQKTDVSGLYTFVNLPIGTYTLTFKHDSFESQKIPSINVQANRTVTLNVSLRVGAVSTTITVEETPLVNAVDTTNGYVLDKVQIADVPLPTGSFTGLAILSPGVNAELASGNGVNAGLGNQPIWANGQRDTSNTFLLNGVDAKNLFNGKSTSSVGSARVVNNTGVSGAASTAAFEIQSSASPYLAVGEALPSPPTETIQEVRVNTSMYDAQQGSTSGAHIDMSTASGTNDFHGSVYLHRATDWLNAAPFFFKQDPHVAKKVPELHREVPGGTFGGPILKNKLFGFVSYQNTHDSDQQIGLGRAVVPEGFTENGITIQNPPGFLPTSTTYPACGADRTTVQFQNCVLFIANNEFTENVTPITSINPVALKILQAKLPNGQYVIPYADGIAPTFNFPETAIVPGDALFRANQAVADLDFIATPKDTLALKYYYQHDPTTAPFAYSSVAGFDQQLDAGSHVATITNTQTLTPNFNVAEVFGFIREKLYSTVEQPSGFDPASLGINAFGSNVFPGITMADGLGLYGPSLEALQLGETGASQGAFTGVFQNRFMPSANAIWLKGKHTITFGGSWSYTQLNTRDNRTGQGMIGFADFSQFVLGAVTPYTADGFIATTFLQGNANRYYRANETGEYIQDKFQLRPNLSITAGLRWDYDGGLSEKNGRLYNFDPSAYSYDPTTDAITSNGFIVAGNNPTFPTKGVSNSTLTGRQWGFAPRVGVAWSPGMFHSKVVVRAGWGIYYDRGELFSYLSPGFAAGVIAGGPFGVNQSPPYVNAQSCTNIGSFYLGFVPTCASPVNAGNPNGGDFQNPWGLTLGPPPSGNPALLNLPNAAAIEAGAQLFSFAVYNRKNKLPYTMNQTLDIQWQPRNDLAIDIGYVGNLGRHEVIPIPFNQARIASPGNPLCGPAAVCASPATAFAPQNYTYGYTVVGGTLAAVNGAPAQPYQANFEGGNVDLRVPFIGYSSESESYTAAGVSAYNALQAHVEKRMSRGVQLGFSYTYSHALDEQSGLGLFYNGNNPTNLRSAYGNSDFDRTHVFNMSYLVQLHNFAAENSWQGKFIDGWAVAGTIILQSGQPYSVIDFSGAVGSIFYGTSDGITNPIVPLASDCTPKSALSGATGAYNGVPALNASCFTLPLLGPGALNGAIPADDLYETNFIQSGQRNIFRQSWQRRADISIVKNTKLTERFNLRYSFDVFNLTNTPSFDIPVDDVTQNEFFNDFPTVGTPALPTSCDATNAGFYNCPTGLGNVNKVIGSAREVQMSLSVTF